MKNRMEINLARGIIVGPEDNDLLETYVWRTNPEGYPIRNITGRGPHSTRKIKTVYLHRTILHRMHGDSQLQCDHINRIKLDNRRPNLRYVTQGLNLRNRNIFKHNNTGFSGVSLLKNGKYNARFCLHQKQFYVGRFATAAEAGKAIESLKVSVGYYND